MINIQEKITKENRLLDEWAAEVEGFVRDGVVCPEQYYREPLKILVLLKEVNGNNLSDLRDYVRDGGRAQTWDCVARWIEGIMRLDEDIPWAELENDGEQRREKFLKKICAVNVKKTAGGHTADNKKVKAEAASYAQRLRQQIELYEPDLVICGGTEATYFENICSEEKPDWHMTERGIWYVLEQSGRVVVSYSHPEARVKKSMLHYGLIDALKEIYKTKNR